VGGLFDGISDFFGKDGGGLSGWLGPLMMGAQVVGSIYGARQQNKQYADKLAFDQQQLAFQASENEKDRTLREALARISAGAGNAGANAAAGATRYAAELGAKSSRYGTASDNQRAILAARLKAMEGGPELVLAAGKPRVEAAANTGRTSMEAFDRLVSRLQGALLA
jgi:hypothetical protein